MDDAVLVGVREGVGHLAEDAHHVGDGQLADPVDPGPQRLAVDVGHDVEEEAVAGARVVQRQDVGMGEARGDFDLAEEAVVPEHGGQLGPQHLDRHLAVVAQVFRQVDGRHATGAQLALDAILAGEGGSEAFRARIHRRSLCSTSMTHTSLRCSSIPK